MAASVLGVHPFNQPDVEVSKELAREALKHGRPRTGETISIEDHGRLGKELETWMAQAARGCYISIQAYLQPTDETTQLLHGIKRELLIRTRLAITTGYGPGFLHSTGQLHKGGPNTGLFLQLMDEPIGDASVPGLGRTFGELINAQSIGDYQALRTLGRRVLRLNLKGDVPGGLRLLEKEIQERVK